MKRVFLIVLDSFGIGCLPDADKFGDMGANTLKSLTKSSRLNIPSLIKCGLGNIDGVDCIEKTSAPVAVFGRCMEKSMGKDTTVGHWEIAGVTSQKPLPTYPKGFPKEVISKFEEACGRGVICNLPYSGTEVIKDYGDEHEKTGKLIVYTSADSVFQIAANEDIVPLDELYRYCRLAREMLKGEHGVGRVIARPFIKRNGEYVRTANRRDFSLEPSEKTVLDELCQNGFDVISVGKINDIFAGRGITEHYATHSNSEGIEKAKELLDKDFCGLAFINLVDFDMLYGHRNDIDGYANALSYFDSHLPKIIGKLRDEDMLIITADHGCDPGDISTDHTREYIPLLIIKGGIKPKSLGTLDTYSVIAHTVADYLGINYCGNEKSILKRLN
ncbi:MAG: phosphopentomutase [Clostridia bacterium]|nr:phosphopentomutase [Clostridia bacterium]